MWFKNEKIPTNAKKGKSSWNEKVYKKCKINKIILKKFCELYQKNIKLGSLKMCIAYKNIVIGQKGATAEWYDWILTI